MTYKQIQQLEDFIKDVTGLKNNIALSDKDLYEQGKTLHERIVACNLGYSLTIPWKNYAFCSFPDNKPVYYVDKIKSSMEVMISALQGILDAIPQYPYILEVRKDIELGKDSNTRKRAYITEMLVKYQGKIDFGKAVLDYVKNDSMVAGNACYEGVLQKLGLYLLEICEEKKVARTQSQSKQNIFNIQQSQNVSQETNVNVEISFEDCFKALDDCETLDDTETQEIKAQLEEIQELLKDKKGKKKSIKQKIGNVLKWIAEKGTDVMIAVLPVVLQSLRGLQ